MDHKQYTSPAQLERNSFLWSEARLVVAAMALFLGGIPPLVYMLGNDRSLWSLLKIAWIISGIASVYLGWLWHRNGHRIFGGNDQKDTAAFVVSLVSGINLGWTALSGNNVGMSIASGKPVFILVGALYLVAAYHLYTRWNQRGQRLFN